MVPPDRLRSVLFTQGEMKYRLHSRGMGTTQSEVAAGVFAGVVQGRASRFG